MAHYTPFPLFSSFRAFLELTLPHLFWTPCSSAMISCGLQSSNSVFTPRQSVSVYLGLATILVSSKTCASPTEQDGGDFNWSACRITLEVGAFHLQTGKPMRADISLFSISSVHGIHLALYKCLLTEWMNASFHPTAELRQFLSFSHISTESSERFLSLLGATP